MTCYIHNEALPEVEMILDKLKTALNPDRDQLLLRLAELEERGLIAWLY